MVLLGSDSNEINEVLMLFKSVWFRQMRGNFKKVDVMNFNEIVLSKFQIEGIIGWDIEFYKLLNLMNLRYMKVLLIRV